MSNKKQKDVVIVKQKLPPIVGKIAKSSSSLRDEEYDAIIQRFDTYTSKYHNTMERGVSMNKDNIEKLKSLETRLVELEQYRVREIEQRLESAIEENKFLRGRIEALEISRCFDIERRLERVENQLVENK
jgi:hypothetical protein